ncbi:MAG: methionyl-tRNA formyltransferase [Solirubrobacterales bacterium]|nr:methionyl-tRNA formyltransferase [Solirubrobacterales bacterium]
MAIRKRTASEDRPVSGAFLGTSDFAATVLEILAASDRRPSLAVTLPDRRRGRGRREQPSPVALKAEELEIELLKSGNVNEEADRERIAKATAATGWASICAFGQLIREPLLSEVPMLNVHPSLLPRWRGAAPVERAIMAGDPETGVAVMRLVAGLDSGPVAAVERVPIGPDESYGELAPRLARTGGRLLVATLTAAADGEIEWTEQDDDAATYAEKIESAERRIDPEQPSGRVHSLVRALNPHIGAWLDLGGERRLGIRQTAPAPEVIGLAPGELTERNGRPVLGCADGAVWLAQVQPPGGKPMDGADWLRGHGLP